MKWLKCAHVCVRVCMCVRVCRCFRACVRTCVRAGWRIYILNFYNFLFQKYCASIPFIQTKYRNTGAALEEMVKLFSVYTLKNSNPNVLFLIVTGTSTDKNKLKDVGTQFKALGVEIICMHLILQLMQLYHYNVPHFLKS